MSINDDLAALGLCWHVEYRPDLSARIEGDEFDHPAAERHYRCTIVIDMMDEATGDGDTEDEAKRAALEDYRSLTTIDDEADDPCTMCGGSGEAEDDDPGTSTSAAPCEACAGTGRVGHQTIA